MITSTSTFVPVSVLESLGSLTAAQADTLPFGVVKLDAKGIIQLYNRYNDENFANFGGKSVIGRNYFTEVAPCANNFIFSGRFMRGAETGILDQVFDYVFTYKIEPTKVRVHLYHHKASGTNWIFVRKI
jgi:photoactive yellow protein